MRFEVYGPFKLERNAKGLICSNAKSRREFWESIGEESPGLPKACGCYVFSVKASRGVLPWYVGKAEKQTFEKECFSAHKINHYNNAIAGRKGIPIIYFLPQMTKRGSFRLASKSEKYAISELESILMGMAISRNPNMLNIKGTRMMRTLTVEGFINSSRKARAGSAGGLRKMLGG